MATNLRSEAAVKDYLLDKLQIIVETILDEIDKLNEEKIQKIVYDVYAPTVYERTEEGENFKSAWGWENSDVEQSHVHSSVTGKFSYKPDNMTYEPDLWQHGSYYGGDVREYLADIIYEGLAGDIFGEGAWTKKRDAWNALVKSIGNDKVRKWINSGAKKAGLRIKW